MQTQQLNQLVGRTLGEYRIEKLLGRAQLGTLYLARQLSQGRTVIVSTFNFPEGLSTVERNQLTARLVEERAALTRLSHPYIVPIYDLGEQSGYLYLVTAFARGSSLSQRLKQQPRFTPEQTLHALKLLGAGLDYAHNQGITHGLLSLSNVLVSSELTIQITGYGLRTLLEVQEHGPYMHSPTSLFNAHGVLLGSPEYVSPEGLLGNPVDARSDIYALGVILFKLLSGTEPFNGSTPLESAMQRIQQPAPSLHAVCSDISEAFDLIVSKALERDPVRRYQRAGDLAADFERALNMLNATRKDNDSSVQQLTQNPQVTLPPTVNWFDQGNNPSSNWQLVPPVVTGYMPALTPSSLPEKKRDEAGNKQVVLPLTAAQPDALTEVLPTKINGHPDPMADADPFAWWATAPGRSAALPPAPGTFARRAPRSNSRSRRYPARQDRRKLVTLMAAGTAGVLMVGGISFAHLVQSMKQPPSQVATTSTHGPTTSATQANTPTVQTTQTPSTSPTVKASPSATRTAQPSPTSQPTQQPTPKPTPKPTQPPPPTPTQPPHTGTVIGHTSMPANSAASFTNPADGQASWLVHMSNGNFVAVEQACTHAGVPVKYNPSTGQFNCPAHGAIFNADGTNPQAPATRPLPPVHITVNADGTITTG